MKKNADKLCQQLLKEKRIRLTKTNIQNIMEKNNSYASNEAGDVIGLNLFHQSLKDTLFLKDLNALQYLNLSQNMITDISMLAELKNLIKLNLSNNRVTNIECLRELKKLSWVDLRNNKISILPTDILKWEIEIKWENKEQNSIVLSGNPLEASLIDAIKNGRKAVSCYFEKSNPGNQSVNRPGETILEESRGPEYSNKSEPIKILILAANPNGTTKMRFDKEMKMRFDKEINKIEEGLRRAKKRDRFELKIPRLAAQYDDFRRALLDNEPQIVHFIGHGTKDGLILEDEAGNPKPIQVEILSELFGLCSKQIKSVILNACYSEPQAKAIGEHIDHVIGMWDKIKDEAAIAFAVGFYDALGAGLSIDEAYSFGCNAIHQKYPDEIQHLVPVLKKGKIAASCSLDFSTTRSLDEKERDVFLSYASEDKESFVEPLAAELQKKGITYWMDRNEIKGGDNFVKAINTGLKTSKYVAVFLSKNFMGKEWPEKELFSAIGRKTPDGRPTLIPIFIAPEKEIFDYCRLLHDVNYIKWSNAAEVANALACSIKTNYASKDNGKICHNPINTHETAISDSILDWCLKQILSDQFEQGSVNGAWSRRYQDYLKILSNEEDTNARDSITFSCWIADALLAYISRRGNFNRLKEIKVNIDRFYNYLFDHYDSKTGGFGIAVPYSTGERRIVFDIRHTAWALLALSKNQENDKKIERMIRMSYNRFDEDLEKLNIQDELPVTNSILHRFLSDRTILPGIFTNMQIVRQKLKLLELSLIQHFNKYHYCWGWFNDRAARMSIDNALSVMYILDFNSIIDEELKDQFKSILNHLLEDNILELEGNKIALPFQRKGEADLGITILFLYVLKKVGHKCADSIIAKLLNFINDPKSIKNHSTSFSFPWHLSAIFHLIDFEKPQLSLK